jgi:hypothetical protein
METSLIPLKPLQASAFLNQMDLKQQIDQEMRRAFLRANRKDRLEQRKILILLKADITEQLNDFNMKEERKSYLLHQLANAQDLSTLIDLIQDLNARQVQDSGPELIGLILNPDGIQFTKYTSCDHKVS